MTWWAAILIGCSDPRPSEPAPQPEPAVDESAVKKSVAMPGPWKRDTIDWDAANAKRGDIDLSTLGEATRQAIANCSVPVLLPTDPTLLQGLKLYTGDGWYAATLHADGYDVMIRGTRTSRSHPASQSERAAMGSPDEPVVTETEGIVTCSVSYAGAAYNIELECAAGPDAPQCSHDNAVALWSSLALAGGAQP